MTELLHRLRSEILYSNFAADSIIGSLLVLMIVVPVGRALLRGYQSARDPNHRVIPGRGPFFFLLFRLCGRLRYWPWIWSAAIAYSMFIHWQLPCEWYYIRDIHGLHWLTEWWAAIWRSGASGSVLANYGPRGPTLIRVDGIAFLGTWMTLAVAACLLWLPHCNDRLKLTFLAVVTAYLWNGCAHLLLSLVFLDGNWSEVVFVWRRDLNGIEDFEYDEIPIPHLGTLTLSGALLLFIIVRIRANHARWFKFDRD